jgi:GWxTD domain-containing protein
MRKFIASLMILSLLLGNNLYAQERVSGVSGMEMRHWVQDNDPYLKIYIQIFKGKVFKEIDVETFQRRFRAFYKIKEDLSDNPRWMADGAEIPWKNTKIIQNEWGILWSFDIAKSQSSPTGILLLDLLDNEQSQKHQFVCRLSFAKTKIREDFAIYKEGEEMVLMTGFVEEGEKFIIKNIKQQSISLYITRFKQNYGAAQSPMNLSQPVQNKNLQVDTVIKARTNETISLQKAGLYLIRQDTTAFYGLGLRVEPKNYPKYVFKEQLVAPLSYIASKQELQMIEKSNDLKQAIDRFWLSLFGGDTEKTREVIKNYYQRIRLSNVKYASFKEGWKTDMGMIYAVFGEPDEIQWEKDSQKWIYRGDDAKTVMGDRGKNFTKLVFTFLRRPNQFFEDYYVLVRFIEFEPVWLSMVDAIRRGVAF